MAASTPAAPLAARGMASEVGRLAARGVASEVASGAAPRTRIQDQRSHSPRKNLPALCWPMRCLCARHARRRAASVAARTTIFVACDCDGNRGLHSVDGPGTLSRTGRRSCPSWVLTARPWLCAAREALPQSAAVNHLRTGRPGRQQRRQLPTARRHRAEGRVASFETKKGCHEIFMSSPGMPRTLQREPGAVSPGP